jgi:hypothetical protein
LSSHNFQGQIGKREVSKSTFCNWLKMSLYILFTYPNLNCCCNPTECITLINYKSHMMNQFTF